MALQTLLPRNFKLSNLYRLSLKNKLTLSNNNSYKSCPSLNIYSSTMGNAESVAHGFDLEELQTASQFSAAELRRLKRRYEKLDADKNGRISAEEFMSLPELANNPLVERIIDTIDTDKSGDVDFQEFIMALSIFIRGDKESKLRFAFRIYDMDCDGYISNGELYQVLKMMVGNNLKDGQLQQIVDKTIMYSDQDGDGKISFEEFVQVIAHTEVEDKMTVEF